MRDNIECDHKLYCRLELLFDGSGRRCIVKPMMIVIADEAGYRHLSKLCLDMARRSAKIQKHGLDLADTDYEDIYTERWNRDSRYSNVARIRLSVINETSQKYIRNKYGLGNKN